MNLLMKDMVFGQRIYLKPAPIRLRSWIWSIFAFYYNGIILCNFVAVSACEKNHAFMGVDKNLLHETVLLVIDPCLEAAFEQDDAFLRAINCPFDDMMVVVLKLLAGVVAPGPHLNEIALIREE